MKKYIPFILCLVILIGSCHKKKTPVNYGIKFDGTWSGMNMCDSSTMMITFHSPVNNANSVYYSSPIDTGFCADTVTFYGFADGDTVSFPSATYQDLCGNGYTVRQTGTIIGVTLYLTRITMGTKNDTCVFVATKL